MTSDELLEFALLLLDTGEPGYMQQSRAYVYKAKSWKDHDAELAQELLDTLPGLSPGEPVMDICDCCWMPFYWQPETEIDRLVAPGKCCMQCWFLDRGEPRIREDAGLDPDYVREIAELVQEKEARK